MLISTAAITASGTATLECAIEELPTLVCYKMSSISWLIAKNLISIEYSSIVNIIANKKIYPELLQNKMNSNEIIKTLEPLLRVNSIERKNMLSELEKFKNLLGDQGVYEKIANSIVMRH